MSMFCYQCQETARNLGCTVRGVCGKQDSLANLMDLLIYSLRGLAWVSHKLNENGKYYPEDSIFAMQGLFTTITNANWSEDVITALIDKTIELRDIRKKELCEIIKDEAICKAFPEAVHFEISKDEYADFAAKVGVLKTENEDVRSLRETITYGLKGIGAYGD
ncbi:MAG TPA: hydroxylamine reductase, partial [Candidatus Cloacimonetes bacterium]|nr:hydroxylamine reductase [Candidatus Cloacimonadota bacterium]